MKNKKNIELALGINSTMTANCRQTGEFWARNLSSAFQTSYCAKTDFLGTASNANFYLEKGI
ncbi:MAG TPA: hypothetical protein PK683_17620, partial [Leptospiraceae bacterium]|nr:hypothetical protein [Leptospiraceae bacterium]